MTNKEFLAKLLAKDYRATLIMDYVIASFKGCTNNPLDMELSCNYKTMWEMFMPEILACSSNNEYHIAHSIGSDLTNIRYEFLRNQNENI